MKRSFFLSVFLFFLLCANAQINYPYFISKAKQNLSEGNYLDALYSLNLAIIAKPENFEAYFLRGLAKYSLDDYFGAIADFDRTLEIHPLYVRALQYRGLCKDQSGDYDDAIKDFNRALELDPFDADIFISRGSTLLHLLQYSQAIDDYDMALVVKPDMALAYVNRGLAKSYLKHYDDALRDMDMAVYYDFMNPDIRFRRGLIQMEREAYLEAMDDFDGAIKMNPNNPLFYFNRAIAFLHQGDTLSALADYEFVNNLDNRNALTYFNRGLLYQDMKDFGKALEMYDLVTAINPDNLYAYFNRSLVYCEMKRWKDAEQDLTKALKLFPDFVGAWINRSIVRDELGDAKGSYLDHEKAMHIIRIANGEDDDADALFEKYADSVYFNKIIAFESDFVNGEAKQKQVQFADVDIVPFGNFVLSLLAYDEYKVIEKNRSFYLDKRISQMNADNKLPAKLVLMAENRNTYSDGPFLNDSIIDSVNDENLRTLLYAIYQDEIYNFRRAEEIYQSLMGNEDLAGFAALNLSALLVSKAELQSQARQYDNTVFITTKKQPDNYLSVSSNLPDYEPIAQFLLFQLLKMDDNAFIWFNLGNVYLQMKTYTKAIDAYSEAIKLNPELAEAYYNRALTLIFIGETKLALSDLSKAGELGLAESYAVMKRFVK